MARRFKLLTIDAEGRDKGKVFRLTEMPAYKAEKWAARALLALLASGLDVPDETAKAGLAGVASMGLGAFTRLEWEKTEPLMDEMMECVQFVPSPGVVRSVMTQADDIEEVSTYLTLRREVLELHLGFSIADKLSISGMSAQAGATSLSAPTSPG